MTKFSQRSDFPISPPTRETRGNTHWCASFSLPPWGQGISLKWDKTLPVQKSHFTPSLPVRPARCAHTPQVYLNVLSTGSLLIILGAQDCVCSCPSITKSKLPSWGGGCWKGSMTVSGTNGSMSRESLPQRQEVLVPRAVHGSLLLPFFS